MKKLLVLLLTVLLLAGCSTSNVYSKPSNSSDVIFKAGNTTYTKNELYKALKLSSESVVETDILASIAKTYGVDVDEIVKEADELVASYLSMGYESMIAQYYGSLESYRSAMISSNIINELANQLIEDKFDEYVANDTPIKLQLATLTTLDEAKELVEKVNNGSTFDSALLEVNENSNPTPYIYLDSDELPLEVKEYLNTTETTGVSTVITTTADGKDADGNDVIEPVYVVLNIISRDVNDFKEEYIETANSVLSLEEITNYFFTKHDIKFYDQDLYEMMSKKYEVLK